MMEGLPLAQERGDQAVNPLDFCFRKGNAFPGFRKDLPVFFLCRYGIIKTLLQCTLIPFRASIAYIWCAVKLFAEFLFKIRACRITFFTAPAEAVFVAAWAEAAVVAFISADACIEGFSNRTGIFKNAVAAYFF